MFWYLVKSRILLKFFGLESNGTLWPTSRAHNFGLKCGTGHRFCTRAPSNAPINILKDENLADCPFKCLSCILFLANMYILNHVWNRRIFFLFLIVSYSTSNVFAASSYYISFLEPKVPTHASKIAHCLEEEVEIFGSKMKLFEIMHIH